MLQIASREVTSPPDVWHILKMIFLFPRWDILVSWKVYFNAATVPNKTTRGISQRVCSLGACQSQVFGKPRKWGILQAFMEENGGFQAVDKDVSCLHPRKLI